MKVEFMVRGDKDPRLVVVWVNGRAHSFLASGEFLRTAIRDLREIGAKETKSAQLSLEEFVRP